MASAGLDRSPDHLGLLKIAGQIHLANGWIAQAAQTFGRMANIRPNDPQVRFDLAEVLVQMDDIPGAVGELQSALELDPAHRPARLALVRALLAIEEIDQAREQIERLRDVTPNSADVAEIDGALHLADGDATMAAAAYERAMALAPSAARAMLLAEALWAGDDRPRALATLDSWLAVHPGDIGPRYQRAGYRSALGNVDNAKDDLRQILVSAPDHVPALNDLAWQLFLAGELEEAATNAEHAHQLAPRTPEIMGTLGVILLTQGETSRARTLLHQAAEQHPIKPEFNYRYAQALVHSGDVDEARGVLRRLLTDDRPFAERDAAQRMLQDLNR